MTAGNQHSQPATHAARRPFLLALCAGAGAALLAAGDAAPRSAAPSNTQAPTDAPALGSSVPASVPAAASEGSPAGYGGAAYDTIIAADKENSRCATI